MKSITTDDLKRWKSGDEDFVLINTLDQEHFDKTRIPDSVNIPQSQDDFVEKVAEKVPNKEKPVVVYCASEECDSSTKAAKKLTDADFAEVYDYEGGAKAWQEAGEPLVS